ncbi:MAG: hypothetical protein ACYC53_06260, partial [Bacillota bacterium]
MPSVNSSSSRTISRGAGASLPRGRRVARAAAAAPAGPYFTTMLASRSGTAMTFTTCFPRTSS